VTLTVDPPAPALSVSPASLSFSAVAGGSSPAAKTLSVTNAGAGTLTYTTSDNASWLSVSPGSGTAPSDVSVSVNVSGLAAGTYSGSVTVTAAGATGSPATIPVTFTVDPPPTLSVSPSSLSFTGTVGAASPAAKTLNVTNTGGGTLSYTASDNASWLAVTPTSGTAPGTLSVSVTTAGLAQGTYNGAVTVTASGAGGSPATIPVTFTVSNTPPPPTGLVGAWGFDEASGASALDSSGAGNVGTLSGPLRTAGRFGGGLQFDGVNDWVTVADANSLDLTTGMTLEAWVRPAALGTVWRTVVLKEQPGQLVYALYAGTDTASRPSGHVFTTSDRALLGPSALPLNTWSHLAMTWDGLSLRVYVNGAQVSSSALTGTARTSTSPLRIGGNAVWPEWFNGIIDEVRVYNRALTAAEIAGDRDTPVGGAGATLASVKRAARANAKKARAKAKRGKPRKTQRKVHRGTRWLKSRSQSPYRRG
jgi:Concanavalin A-like lectin/glucanases superfamily/Viral BACON domain